MKPEYKGFYYCLYLDLGVIGNGISDGWNLGSVTSECIYTWNMDIQL